MQVYHSGLLTPLWTLRDEKDLGIGDLRSLELYIPWCAEHGVDFIQLLPITETDDSFSPYSGISSIALEPIYLNVWKLGLEEHVVEQTLKGLSPEENERVNYPEVNQRKNLLFQKAYEQFKLLSTDNDFEEFCRSEEWLDDYALFRALVEKENSSSQWELWDAQYNQPEKAQHYLQSSAELQQRVRYYKWLQWQCFSQWKAIRAYADSLQVKLMGDMPVGVSFNSADVFFERENFDLNWFGGAPPEKVFKDDPFAVKWGQNWGIPLYNEQYLIETDFAWWRRRVSKLTEIFSLYRIDHILGFYRIYAFPWNPVRNAEFFPLTETEAMERCDGKLPGFKPFPDETTEQKEANLARGDQLLRVVQEASGDAIIIAEDLGHTPDYVRPHLKSLEVSGFRIIHWEADEHGNPRPAEDYPYYSFAAYSTHDHAPLKGLWSDYQKDAQSELPEERESGEYHLSVFSRIAAIEEYRAQETLNDDQEWKLIEQLFATNSQFVALQITEFLGLDNRFNTPSTVGSHNWTYRIPYTVKDLVDLESLSERRLALKSLTHKRKRKA